MIKNIPTSNYDQYCTGYQNPDNEGPGYILGVSLNIGAAPISFGSPDTQMLDEINAFDIAEAEGTYLGQINMIKVSSFCGPQGLIWGYDIAKHPAFNNKQKLLLQKINHGDQKEVPVYSAKPLMDATQRLIGTRDKKRFPILAGSHVPCATKKIIRNGPCHLYCALAIGIPKHRDKDACLLMEDIGEVDFKTNAEKITNQAKQKILMDAAKSVLVVGANQKVQYAEIFVEMTGVIVDRGDIGCALIAAPYLTLAKQAVPAKFQKMKDMRTISLQSWEKKVKSSYVSV